jgi:uncharacterized HAD superfamily protein
MKKQALENIAQVWRKKQLIKDEVDTVLGEFNLSNTAIYAAANKVNIAAITQHKFFIDKSFSTIKRAVLELKHHKLIEAVTDTVDRRVQWLEPTQEK